MNTDDKDEDMICALTADEHAMLKRRLRALPDTPPPRAVWERTRAQAEAEGLFGRGAAARSRVWYAGGGLAAAVVLSVVLVRGFMPDEAVFSPTPSNDITNVTPVNVLEALMVESRQLENDLRSLPAEPRVVRAGTQATILEIEDRIAAIDYQLSDPQSRLTAEEQEIFWRERVRLMKSLVRLRYAQAQRTAF